MQAAVQILLATYNGERFLREQLDSLLNQSFQDFTILIRDDGSTDSTLEIIAEYIRNFSGKIVLFQDNLKNVGAARNFGILLENSSADYLFFCDQDDVWLKHKIETCLSKIKSLEHQNTSIPCLVFSDMKSIDEEGNILSDSVWKTLLLHPDFCTLNRLLVQNMPHGCTMVFNKAMRNLAAPIPAEAIMHDQWFSLLAVACGKCSPIEEPLVLLRDHARNVTRKKSTLTETLKRFSANLLSKKEYEYFIRLRVNQAKALKERISECASQEQLDILDNFFLLEKTSGLKRKQLFLKHKFYRSSFWHTFKMISRA